MYYEESQVLLMYFFHKLFDERFKVRRHSNVTNFTDFESTRGLDASAKKVLMLLVQISV